MLGASEMILWGGAHRPGIGQTVASRAAKLSSKGIRFFFIAVHHIYHGSPFVK
jgi:hypothetical protein